MPLRNEVIVSGDCHLNHGIYSQSADRTMTRRAQCKSRDNLRKMNELQKALLAMKAAGSNGFEGVVADALSELTNQSFGLMKSGPQGGVDGLSKPIVNRLIVGFEGKRYRTTTPLKLDELKAKLLDAVRSYPSMDLWLLATTRELARNDALALEQIGEEYGVGVQVLDWPAGAKYPEIALIIAGAPKTARHHFGDNAAVLAELDSLRKEQSYPLEAERLLAQLTQADIGLGSARARAQAHLVSSMSDKYAALSEFNSHAAIEEPSVKRIRRADVSERIDGWWKSDSYEPLVLLGTEGTGKTWAALSWWLDDLSGREDAPLTLVVPARDINNIDGPGVVADALARVSEVRDAEFWRKRIKRWSSCDDTRSRILLIIDGLDQNWAKDDWDDLALSLLTPQWRGKVRLMMTCRPDHWNRNLAALPGLPEPVSNIPVIDFSDPEVDELLSLHGLTRDQFDKAVIPLLKRPRLSVLAIERRQQLSESGDITPERLIYEDWRYRRPAARKSMTNDRFFEFISELGSNTKAVIEDSAIGRSNLLQRIAEPVGKAPKDVLHVLGELIDGDWLVPAETGDHFILDPKRAPAALALSLLDEVKKADGVQGIEQVLAERFEPMGALDIGVAILRHAVTFALLDPAAGRIERRVLLEQWLTSQNFSGSDFQSFWRVIGCDPELVIELAETCWFGSDRHFRIDEVLCKGFANAFKWPEVSGPLTAKLLVWFSRYWLDPLQGEVIGKVTDDDTARERRNLTEGNAAECKRIGLDGKYRLNLVEVQPDGQAWGCYRAAELLSWLPRAPLIDVYTAWAITRAIMNGERQFKAMAWNLRWFADEEFEGDGNDALRLILNRAAELLGEADELSKAAGKTLVEATATAACWGLIGEDGEAPPGPKEIDPVVWGPVPDNQRFRDSPLDAAMFLQADPLDPKVDLPDGMAERLASLARRVSVGQARALQSHEDGGVSAASTQLVRWAPGEMARLIRIRHGWIAQDENPVDAQILPEDRESRPVFGRPLTRGITSALLLLEEREITNWRRFYEGKGHLSGHDLEGALVAMKGMSASEQILLLERFPVDFTFPTWTSRLFTPPIDEDFEKLSGFLNATKPEDVIRFWLRYLSAVDLRGMPVGWQPLASLIGHGNTNVQSEVFALIAQSQDVLLADEVAISGWHYAEADSREEQANGTLALCCSSYAPSAEISDRVHPDYLGYLSDEYPDTSEYLNAFANHVRDELSELITAKSRSYPHGLFLVERGWDQLITKYESEFRKWMAPFVNTKRDIATHFGFGEEFPLIDCLQAYDKIEPGTFARLLGDAIAPEKRGAMRFGDLYRLAATIDGPGTQRLRDFALDEANNDQKLADFAINLQVHGHTEWLLSRIRKDLGGPSAATTARAVTLAGFLAPGSLAEALWSGELADPPTAGWLEQVHQASKSNYRTALYSRHWRDEFFNATVPESAFSAFELFAESVDRRLFVEADEWRDQLNDGPKSLHWNVNADRLRSNVDKRGKEWAKTYLMSKPPLNNQAPKMH